MLFLLNELGIQIVPEASFYPPNKLKPSNQLRRTGLDNFNEGWFQRSTSNQKAINVGFFSQVDAVSVSD